MPTVLVTKFSGNNQGRYLHHTACKTLMGTRQGERRAYEGADQEVTRLETAGYVVRKDCECLKVIGGAS